MAKNILICDDAAFMRMMIKDILTKNGYNVVGEAENGAKGVEKYNELKIALTGTDIDKIRELTLEVHAMVHPAEISGKTEKTIADFVLDYMLKGNQNAIVPREDYDVDNRDINDKNDAKTIVEKALLAVSLKK